MELNESEIYDTMAKTIADFVDGELFACWIDDEKEVIKRLLTAFCDDLRTNLVETECKKLDKMAEASE